MQRCEHKKPRSSCSVSPARWVSGCAASIAVLAACAGSLIGCAGSVSQETRDQISQQTSGYRTKGSGSISGVVKLDTSRGTMLASGGTQVLLTPATSYALARFQEYVVEKNQLPEERQAELVLF